MTHNHFHIGDQLHEIEPVGPAQPQTSPEANLVFNHYDAAGNVTHT